MEPSSTPDSSNRIIRIVMAVAVVIIAIVLLWPKAKEHFEPTPLRADVAILPAGSTNAIVGPVKITPGTEFTLYAVLEAETRGGERVYYTEAPALQIDGKSVPADALRRWDRPQIVKVFWFTIEGPAPYLELKSPENLDRFKFTEFFRPDWPATWSAPGRLDSNFDENLARGDGQEGVLAGFRRFGTQRYQVRIELFNDEKKITPEERFISPGGSALPDALDTFPTVYAAYPGAAGPASLAFGLTQIEPPPDAGPDLQARLADLTRRHLAFARLPLIGEVIAAAGKTPDSLDWQDVDLSEGSAPVWRTAGDGGTENESGSVSRGDLLRAGGRIVVLYEDRGTPGRLDRDDLCFDFEQGAEVLPLSEVFVGEGLLELARL